MLNRFAADQLAADPDLLPRPDNDDKAQPGDMQIRDSRDIDDELQDVARYVKTLAQQAPDRETTAVVVNSNKDADQLSETLTALDVSHFKVSGTDIFALPQVKWLLAHLSVLSNELNHSAWSQLLTGLRVCESEASARGWLRKMRDLAISPADFLRPNDDTYLQEFLSLYERDDIVVFDAQAQGVLAYSDTHIGTKAINVEENKWRIEEQHLPEFLSCCCYVNKHADAFAACLYEYYMYYNKDEYRSRLHYMPLPIEIPDDKNISVKGENWPIKVLVGIQKRRDFIKGASIIGEIVEKIAAEYPDKVVVNKVYDVPYIEYCKMLEEADVLVDQLYSYTPSMNSLAAMARGTVVIGGGEEEYYDFIGEKELRPIINVRPHDDEYNLNVLREALLTPGRISKMSRESAAFVRKHHDYMKVSRQYIEMYDGLLS